jgi:hypothetical protein
MNRRITRRVSQCLRPQVAELDLHHQAGVDLEADQSGGLVNYSSFGAETGVASKTIREYYQVLEDTLVAFAVPPYTRSARKRLPRHPIYHLFDPTAHPRYIGAWPLVRTVHRARAEAGAHLS